MPKEWCLCYYYNFSDYNEFLDDLESDPQYRQNVNIYRNPQAVPLPPITDDEDDERPRISLQEMLEDLNIEDQEMKEVPADVDDE